VIVGTLLLQTGHAMSSEINAAQIRWLPFSKFASIAFACLCCFLSLKASAAKAVVISSKERQRQVDKLSPFLSPGKTYRLPGETAAMRLAMRLMVGLLLFGLLPLARLTPPTSLITHVTL